VPKVMIVEDDEMVRTMVSRILRKEGHDVIGYPDAAPALQEADLNAIELILTDLSMPTPGEQLIQAVRKRGATPPIVVMSGHLSEEKLQLLEALGIQAFLEKPFDLSALLQIVQKHAISR